MGRGGNSRAQYKRSTVCFSRVRYWVGIRRVFNELHSSFPLGNTGIGFQGYLFIIYFLVVFTALLRPLPIHSVFLSLDEYGGNSGMGTWSRRVLG